MAASSRTRYLSSTSTGRAFGVVIAVPSRSWIEGALAGSRPMGNGRRLPLGECQLLERLERVDRSVAALDLLGSAPPGIRPELPRASIVGEHHLDDRSQASLRFW